MWRTSGYKTESLYELMPTVTATLLSGGWLHFIGRWPGLSPVMWGWKHWSVSLRRLKKLMQAKLLEQCLRKEHSPCADNIHYCCYYQLLLFCFSGSGWRRVQVCLRAYSMILLEFKLILIPFHKLSLLAIGDWEGECEKFGDLAEKLGRRSPKFLCVIKNSLVLRTF